MRSDIQASMYLDEMALPGNNSSVAEDDVVSTAPRKGVSGGKLPFLIFEVKSTPLLSSVRSSAVLDSAAELETKDEYDWL